MAAIGSFQFPADKTFYEVRMIEAKSKVRKEIEITFLIENADAQAFQDSLLLLQSSVEAFDHGKAKLMLHEGRFSEGRRRSLEIVPDVHHQLAFVKLVVFTHDRYERSLALHQIENAIVSGVLNVSVWNQGNWLTEPVLTITPDSDMEEITIIHNEDEFQLQYVIPADQTLMIDSAERTISVNGQNIAFPAGTSFPVLSPGQNQLQITCVPNTVNAQFQIQHRDVWV